jgi:hypothetical protein
LTSVSSVESAKHVPLRSTLICRLNQPCIKLRCTVYAACSALSAQDLLKAYCFGTMAGFIMASSALSETRPTTIGASIGGGGGGACRARTPARAVGHESLDRPTHGLGGDYRAAYAEGESWDPPSHGASASPPSRRVAGFWEPKPDAFGPTLQPQMCPPTPPPSPRSGEDFASQSLVIWSMFQSAEPPKRLKNTTLGFGNPVWRASGGVGEHHAVGARCVCRLPPHAPPPAPQIANLGREGLDRPTEHSGGLYGHPKAPPTHRV